MKFLIPVLVWLWLVIVLACGRHAGDKGIDRGGAYLLGLLSGPVGLAVIMLLPAREKE